MSNFIFKLTPNNRQVVINSDVLNDGYKEVQYPIIMKETTSLGYVQDPDTFKFVDHTPFLEDNTPYPVDMKIQLILNNAPFYGVNSKLSDDKIEFNVNFNYSDGWTVSEGDDITYDTYTIDNLSAKKSEIKYKIIVDIYWSDNISHIANNVSNKVKTVSEFGGINSFTLRIDGKLNPQKRYETELNPKGYILPSTETSTSDLTFSTGTGTSGTLATFPDSIDTYEKEIATVQVQATYVCPDSLRTVTAYTTEKLKQDPHPGMKPGYVKVSFIDYAPLDVWSPTVTPIYTKSVRDEANIKVDKGSFTEYYAFTVKGEFQPDKKKYEGIAQQISLTNFNNTGITSYVIPCSKIKTNYESILDSDLMYFIDTSKHVITPEQLDASLSYYVNSNTFDYDEIILNNFYTDNFEKLEPGAVSNYDKSVFGTDDHNNFISLLEKYTPTNYLQQTDLFDLPKDDDQEFIRGDSSVSCDLKDNFVKYNCLIFAVYAKYVLKDNTYQQIVALNNDSYYVNNESKDLNIDQYDSNNGTKVQNIVPDEIYPFKVIQDEFGNSVQYKYCVNSLIDSNIQIPRYAVYPKLSGYIGIPFLVYNYEDKTHIPVIDSTDPNFKKIIGDKQLITRIGTSLTLNYTEGFLSEFMVDIVKYVSKNKRVSIKPGFFDNTLGLSNNVDLSFKDNYTWVVTQPHTGILHSLNNMNNVISTTVQTTPTRYGAVYGAASSYSIEVKADQSIRPYIRVNGVTLDISASRTTRTSTVKPGIFVISIDEDYPKDYSGTVKIGGCVTGTLIITNDENEKHLTKYDNDGKDIGNEHSSSMLLRANPKLSGNVKLVVDTDYNLYLDTFKATPVLNDHKYRKYPVSDEGNYPRDIKKVFKSIPSNELFATPLNALKSHKVYNDFNDQYETMYEYGAETNKDNLYSENMKILAPLHIGDDVPEYFAIFKYDAEDEQKTFDNTYIEDIDKFKLLIKDSTVVKTYDLRKHTAIGQYLNNYQQMLTNYGQCYLQFIEQDYDKNSKAYRQGTNIWKGISVKRGILTDQSETTYFGSKILNSDIINKQEVFNDFIMQGFERNNLLYPNIINLEFMFNDNEEHEYSMHRYFGLYLTANEFIKYGYVLSKDNDTKDNKFVKYDVNGNVFKGDIDLFNTIFTSKYSDRIFYAITNDDASRVQSIDDVNTFINDNVKNKPECNLASLKSDEVIYSQEDNSFITLHFTKPLKYGEHIKIIAMNYVQKGTTYTNIKDVKSSKIPYEHVVFELIASNDIRLREADNYISPTVTTNKCRYSENTYFNRISFYSQDIDYPEVTATIEEQIQRIIACIMKFNSFIRVTSHNKNSIAIMSEHDEMYLQHIAVNDFDDFVYDYMLFKTHRDTIVTTNKNHTDSIDFMTVADNPISYVEHYDQTHDDEHDWVCEINDADKTNGSTNLWHCYVEAEDPRNISYDTISYFNPNAKYLMHALSNQSDYFNGYYAAFCNYGFESLGWRYNTIVQFQKTTEFAHSYVIYDNIYDVFNTVKYPLVFNNDGLYDTLNIFDINSGYLRNNLVEPDLYEEFTSIQKFIFNVNSTPVITSPFDVSYTMIATKNNSLLNNNEIHLYKPLSSSIAIMGVSNILDIDTIVNNIDAVHMETNLNIKVDAQTSICIDESDPRLQHGVMYEVVSGDLYAKAASAIRIPQGNKFILLPDGKIYIETIPNVQENVQYLYAGTSVVYKVCDRQYYQEYKYDSSLPTLNTDNFHKDPNNTIETDLIYPVVPAVNCNWKSNGTYYDFNEVLNVDMLKFDYEPIGNFTENVYTASDFVSNQYVTNRIDNILYVNDEVTTYKDCIINKKLQNPIKKLLIDNVNIKTASAYYNANIQSLEFIFNGVKFSIKLNSKVVNSYIHLDEYSGFEVFVINDYQLTKQNELYISLEEQFILLVNHQFYIEYAHEAENNVKVLNDQYTPFAPYSVYAAPYCLDMSSSGYVSNSIIGYKKAQERSLHKSLMASIDEHNLWSSLFVQYDIPKDVYTDDNQNQYIQSYIETIAEYNDYVTMFKTTDYPLGVLSGDNVINATSSTVFKSISSISNSLIITKADGEYNHQAQILLKSINEGIANCAPVTTSESPVPKSNGNLQKLEVPKEAVYYTNIAPLRKITLREPVLSKRLERTGMPMILDKLSKVIGGNEFRALLNPNENILDGFKNIMIPRTQLKPLQTYIEKLIALESDRERLERYCKSVDDNIDIYVIPKDSEVHCIHNNDNYNPLLFSLSVPTHIKYNYGWFTPNTKEMVSYDINDELSDILNVDLLQANTKINNVLPIKNYTGNKVFEDTKLTTLNKNYFTVDERSLLSTTWDNGYYRLYTTEDNYRDKPGYVTGIDDKSFFGSKCMVIHNPYLLLDTWEFNSSNDMYSVSTVDSPHNSGTKNTKCIQISINLSAVIYAHFINNESFAENWNKYKDSQNTGMKNYITNIISTYYNLNSDIDVKLYAIDQIKNGHINILNEKPADINSYYVYENYSTHVEYKNNIYTLTILINETSGINIYPTVKIYRK